MIKRFFTWWFARLFRTVFGGRKKNQDNYIENLNHLNIEQKNIKVDAKSILPANTPHPATKEDWCALLREADFESSMIEKILQGEKTFSSTYRIMSNMKMTGFEILKSVDHNQKILNSRRSVIVIFGVNGSGKTSFCGKIFKWLIKNKSKEDSEKKIVFVAGDTFRAAAMEQLSSWIKHDDRAIFLPQDDSSRHTPSGLVFSGIKIAEEMDARQVFIDTSGRLPNNANLIAEFKKICDSVKKAAGDNFDVYHVIVLDSTFGKNALCQIEAFSQVVKIDACVVTKMDCHSKAGFIFSIVEKYSLPIWFLSNGNDEESLVQFNPEVFCDSLFSIVQ